MQRASLLSIICIMSAHPVFDLGMFKKCYSRADTLLHFYLYFINGRSVLQILGSSVLLWVRRPQKSCWWESVLKSSYYTIFCSAYYIFFFGHCITFIYFLFPRCPSSLICARTACGESGKPVPSASWWSPIPPPQRCDVQNCPLCLSASSVTSLAG